MHNAGFFLRSRSLTEIGQNTICPDICPIVSPPESGGDPGYAQQVSSLNSPRAECALFIRHAGVYPQHWFNDVVVVVYLVSFTTFKS